MKSPKINSTSNRGKRFSTNPWLWGSLLLATLLAALFWRNFLPGNVLFANDGPLGQQNAAWQQMPSAMTGMWYDLNSIGYTAGSASPSISGLIKLFWEGIFKAPLGPLCFANSYAPIGLFILGLGALFFFKTLKFSPFAALLGALATMLNSTFFGVAGWGIVGPEIAMGFNFLALALVMTNTAETPRVIGVIRLALAGLCVGMNVMEAADVGALASIMVALVVGFKAFADEEGPVLNKAIRGVTRVAMIAIFAGFIALQTIVSLVGTSITGVTGTAQDAKTKAEHWDFATQWSLPKKETLGLFVPGLFGFKMDTPNEMPAELQDAYRGGLYWGGMGRDPANDRFLDSGAQGQPPDPEWMRQTGNGNYCGIVVALIGAWAVCQSFRRKNSIFSTEEKRWIWFWSAVLVTTLLLAWGRFAPFYALIYQLPYFSTIRNPTKFITFFSVALIILFAYGMNALSRNYLKPAVKPGSFLAWWKIADPFDHKWILTCSGLFAISVGGWFIYSGEKPALIEYLQKVGFGDEDLASQIASFSLSAVGWFIILLAATLVLLALLISGWFNGPRAKVCMGLLTSLLLFDFVRADLPYIINWNYINKYEVGTLNPVESFLREKPYEHRVAILPFDPQVHLRDFDDNFGGLGIYRIEWAQHHFPYYNIQSLDIIQLARMPEDLKQYLDTLRPHSMADLPEYTRLWELTNTRYLLGAAGFLEILNTQLDPGMARFKILQRFDILNKPGVKQPTGLEDLTAESAPDGDLALFEFTGALPRAMVYSNWQVNTNDATVLKTLSDLNFDPAKTVLVATTPKNWPASATNTNDGTVEYQSYGPDDILLKATASAPSILLLNDRYDPDWSVTVDDKPAELLRCNYIMRGVCLPPGEHTVAFRFRVPARPLYITLTALGLGLLLAAILAWHEWRAPTLKAEPAA